MFEPSLEFLLACAAAQVVSYLVLRPFFDAPRRLIESARMGTFYTALVGPALVGVIAWGYWRARRKLAADDTDALSALAAQERFTYYALAAAGTLFVVGKIYLPRLLAVDEQKLATKLRQLVDRPTARNVRKLIDYLDHENSQVSLAAESTLRTILQNTSDVKVAHAALELRNGSWDSLVIEANARARNQAAVSEIVERSTSSQWPVRRTAFEGLIALDHPESLRVAKKLLSDEIHEIQGIAVRHLADKGVVDFLEPILMAAQKLNYSWFDYAPLQELLRQGISRVSSQQVNSLASQPLEHRSEYRRTVATRYFCRQKLTGEVSSIDEEMYQSLREDLRTYDGPAPYSLWDESDYATEKSVTPSRIQAAVLIAREEAARRKN